MISVSVVIPAYNAAKFLAETLQSVLGQTYRPLEILVIDDGSSDNTSSIAHAFGPPVKVIGQANAGECGARNRGLEEARGDWIAFLDADDRWEPEKLRLQVEEIGRHQDPVCVHSGFYLFGLKNKIPPPREAPLRGIYDVETMLLNPQVNSSTAVVRAGLSPRFPMWARQGGDMLYFIELSKQGKFAFVPQALAGYRIHGAQVTKNNTAWIQHFENRFRWLQDHVTELGEQKGETLRKRLQQQILEWLELARWTRQWPRYWSLRQYAISLDWGSDLPAGLRQRILPRFCYSIKDFVDRLFRKSPAMSLDSRSAPT